MRELLIIYVAYSIGASFALVGSTLIDPGRGFDRLSRIEPIGVSDYLLLKWAGDDPNLVIFDVHRDRGFAGRIEFTSYWLPIPTNELPDLLKWLPPSSRVVFCCKDAVEHLDGRAQTILLQCGIRTVHFLIDGFQACHDLEITASDFSQEVTGQKREEGL